MFGSWFKTYLWKIKYCNIGTIVPVDINGVVSRMEILTKVASDDKKIQGIPTVIKSNKGVIDTFIYEHMAKTIIL